MPVHEDDGSAVTSAPPSSPPPQPEATSASAATSSPKMTSALRFSQSTCSSSPWIARLRAGAADVAAVSALALASANGNPRGATLAQSSTRRVNAGGGGRTHTSRGTRDFESRAPRRGEPMVPPRAPSFGPEAPRAQPCASRPAEPASGPDVATTTDLFPASMPEVGVEPTRPEGHGILSPARLPVPPLRPAAGW